MFEYKYQQHLYLKLLSKQHNLRQQHKDLLDSDLSMYFHHRNPKNKVAGINAPATISVTDGEYSIDGGAFTPAAGMIDSGQTVAVRHTSSASNSTDTTTTLTIGGVAGTFTSITVAPAGNPPLPGGRGALDGFSLLALGLVGLLRRRKLQA